MAEEETDTSTTTEEGTTTEVDPLSMGDEEFTEFLANGGIPEEGTTEESDDSSSDDDSDEDDNEDVKDDESDSDEDADDASDDDESDDDKTDEDDDAEDDKSEDGDDDTDADKEDDDKEKDSDKDEDDDKTDAKTELAKLFAPFRANGKDMQVNSVEEALTFMKMGANYNKKMAAMKPGLKVLKMLDNNNLLDESKLTYLIDLDKKDPEAIKKLIKDSGIDPLDIDVKSNADYKPTEDYTVDDKEVELDGVLAEIKDTDSFEDTIDIIKNKWDDKSRDFAVSNPQVLSTINDHVATGIYKRVMDVVDHQRALGKLPGLSDLEAYKHVGDAINAQGGFDPKPDDSKSADTTTEDTATKKKVTESKRKSKKRAASTTKSTSNSKAKDDFNPLAMSDEDFEKAMAGKL